MTNNGHPTRARQRRSRRHPEHGRNRPDDGLCGDREGARHAGHLRQRLARLLMPVLWKTVAVLTVVGFLGGCAQQDGAWRQARVDACCHDPRIGSSPQAVAQCLQYYVRNTNIEVPDTSGLPSLSSYSPPSASAPPTYTPPSYSPPPSHSSTHGRTEVALLRGGGTFHVPVTINGAIRLPFIIDSGAADVTIPDDVMLTLIRSGTINDDD